MDFGFSEEQDLLRQEVRRLLDERCPMGVVRDLCETPSGHSQELWKQLGEMGALGLVIPEIYGGAGLGWVDAVVALEELGRGLCPAPLISTLLAGAAIADAASDAQKQRWLPALADGTRIGGHALFDAPDVWDASGVELVAQRDGDDFVLDGVKPWVHDAQRADWWIVAFRTERNRTERNRTDPNRTEPGVGHEDVTLAIVERDADGVSLEELTPLDATRRLAHVRLDGVRVAPDAVLGPVGGGGAALDRLVERGAAAVSAEIIGAGEGALALTVQFAKDRIQFGQPIGHFQGVKHPLAEMYVDLESLKSLVHYAAWALDAAPDEVPGAVSEAKAFASEIFTRIGIDCVQLHGAVGYTLEYDVQLYLKRSKSARPLFGDEHHHYDRIAALGGY